MDGSAARALMSAPPMLANSSPCAAGADMKATRSVIFLVFGSFTAAIILLAGCSTMDKKPTARPSHSAAAANDFPTALQAGISSPNVKK
jgi:hypothetical protein